jgi:hypothetical protein
MNSISDVLLGIPLATLFCGGWLILIFGYRRIYLSESRGKSLLIALCFGSIAFVLQIICVGTLPSVGTMSMKQTIVAIILGVITLLPLLISTALLIRFMYRRSRQKRLRYATPPHA